MGVWANIILMALQFVNMLLRGHEESKWLNAGEAQAVAKAATEILRKSGYAKQALEEAAAMSDAELDQRLRDFEPGNPDGK